MVETGAEMVRTSVVWRARARAKLELRRWSKEGYVRETISALAATRWAPHGAHLSAGSDIVGARNGARLLSEFQIR